MVADALKAEGFDVWWDAVLRAGESYDEVTEENLRTAGAVVVLWSQTSSKSKWVRAEATIGERHSTLVPAVIEDCDRPLRFELIQTADLTEWTGDRDDLNWQGLIADINTALGKTAPAGIASAASIEAKAPPKPAPKPSDTTEKDTIETVFWSTIKDTDQPAELEAYLKRYKNGHFVDLARARLAAITADAPAAKDGVTPPQIEAGIPHQLIAIAIFAIGTMIGMGMLVAANALHVGSFTWTPAAGADQLNTGAIQIGFLSALNWSVAALVLMPTAWMLIYLALIETREAWGDMVRKRMLVTDNFEPITADHAGFKNLRKHIRLFVTGGVVAATIFTIVLAVSDHAQVAGRFYDNPAEAEKLDRIDTAGYALETPDIERDWMVAAFLTTPKTDKPARDANYTFSLFGYVVYVGIGIGALISFGLLTIWFGATFMRGIAKSYGFQIIPSLESNNKRCGFEVVQRFFVFAVAVAFIGCVMSYLMGIQNIYLRGPHESIFAMLAPDFAALSSAVNWRESIDALVGFLFAESVAKGTRNIYVWIFGFFIFAVFIGGFMFFLREGATMGRKAIQNEIRDEGFARLQKLTRKSEEDVQARLAAMKVWPLEQLSLHASLAVVTLFVLSFVFYKLGALIVFGLCMGLPVILLRSNS